MLAGMATQKPTSKLTSAIAARGGEARAARLTPEQRSEIARQGGRAKWRGHEKLVKAERAGVVTLGSAALPCANLPDGRRVLSEASILAALGIKYSGYYSKRDAALGNSGVSASHRSVSPRGLANHIPKKLADMLASPIAYLPPGAGAAAKGIPAEALPLICEVWIKARDAGDLKANQLQTAARAEALYKGLAAVGITALVDEATGAQIDRARGALAKFLESFVTKELAAWEKTFDDAFYQEMFRLRGWNAKNIEKRPGVVGSWTTDIVYKRLAPGVLQRLQEIVPRDANGRLKFKLHQALTRDKGYMKLKEHLASVTTLMKVSDDGDWAAFMKNLDRVLPRYEKQLLMRFMNEGKADEGEGE